MQPSTEPSKSPGPGQVNQIRRQWAVQEDEALAYKLQDEEITQHYSRNRFRNSTVREDHPRAKEEQEREDREALEERFRKLKLLQRQDEEDGRLARTFSEELSDQTGAVGGTSDEDLDFDILDTNVDDAHGAGGAAGFTLNEAEMEDLRRMQEKRDEIFARQLQGELEQQERDKLIAIEAQDRELAKMLYIKEKAKIKRARERAKLKAETAAASAGSDTEYSAQIPSKPPSALFGKEALPEETCNPPMIPEKLRTVEADDPTRFRAVPKSLPPHPPNPNSSSSSRNEPVPPYMPMQGFKIQNKRK